MEDAEIMLETFRACPLGKVYLTNAYLAYKAKLFSYDVIKNFLLECESFCNNDPSKNTAEVIEAFPSKNYFFYRLPLPEIFDDVTTVICFQNLSSRAGILPWLINKDGQNTYKTKLADLAEQINLIKNEIPFDERSLVEILQSSDYVDENIATLGERDENNKVKRLVWFAPEQDLTALKISCKKDADFIRDVLGLAHVHENFHLIQITIKKDDFNSFFDDPKLNDKKNNKKFEFAAPTFIEAGANTWFRTWTACEYNWGKTQALKDVASHNGVKEAVSSPVPYKTTYKIYYLGKTLFPSGITESRLGEHVQTLWTDAKEKDLSMDKIVNELKEVITSTRNDYVH